MITEQEYEEFYHSVTKVTLNITGEIYTWKGDIKNVEKLEIFEDTISKTYDFKEMLSNDECDEYLAVNHDDLLKYFSVVTF